LTPTLRRWASFTLSRSSPRDHRERRSRGVFQGTASAVAGRVLTILVSVVSVPLTVGYLGGERYGAWVTIASVLTFLSITDLGLAASLTNALGKAQAEDAHDRGQRYVSSAFLMLSLIAFVILILASTLAPRIAAFLFPNLQSSLARIEIVPAVMIALSIFALNLPFLVNARVLAAYQESALANLWNIAGSLGNLAALLAVIWFRGGLPCCQLHPDISGGTKRVAEMFFASMKLFIDVTSSRRSMQSAGMQRMTRKIFAELSCPTYVRPIYRNTLGNFYTELVRRRPLNASHRCIC